MEEEQFKRPRRESDAEDRHVRRYDNRGREEKAKRTRDAIVEALAAQLVENNAPDFSVADAAKQAGVTTRTVFRHFPSREHMLEGVSEWVLRITGRIALPSCPADLPDVVRANYRLFDEYADLMRALLLSDLGRGVRARLSPRRREAIRAALAPAVAHLPVDDARAVTALLAHLVGVETWWQLRDAHGTPDDAAARAAAWAIDALLASLDRDAVATRA